MSELKRIVEDFRSIFSESSYPQDFLDTYDQMECLADHRSHEVFLVRNKKTGEMAVAKCYDRSVFPRVSSPDLLKDISHPGLPRCIGTYQNEHILCVVREYVEGTPLSEYAAEQQLSINEITSFALELCEILKVLHGHTPPVIHRDIKPENIIVRPDKTLALIDFDISRFYKESAAGDTSVFGTKGYAPPEQYGFGQTDNRADIYAVGVLLRWLITGSTKANSLVAINGKMQKIIDRCTAFSPEDRYSDIAPLQRDLKKAEKNGSSRTGKVIRGIALTLLLVCLGFALGRFSVRPLNAPRTQFTEPVIEQAVRLQLNKETGALTEEDLAQVRHLYIFGSEAYNDPDIFYRQSVDQHAEGPIRTLDDLRLLTNLEDINIFRQGNVDITAIAELTHLHTVNLKHMRISDVAPIACVGSLKHVVLFDCDLSDVSALENCTRLESLDIGRNRLTDLNRIGTYPGVKDLVLMWLEMDGLGDIAVHFPHLKNIMLQHGRFGDLSGLTTLPELETVYVLDEQQSEVAAVLSGTGIEIRTTEN